MTGFDYASRTGTFGATVTASASLGEIRTQGFGVLAASFAVTVAALTEFIVQGRVSVDGEWFAMSSVAADYTTPNAPILDASGSLVTAAVGSHYFKMDVLGLESVRFMAAGTATLVDGDYGLV